MKRLLLTLTGVLVMMTVFAQDLSVCASKGYTLKPDAPAIGATSYQWYEDGKLLFDSNSDSYTIGAGTRVPGTYAYVRMAANAECPGVPSNTFTVRVYPAFSPGSITTAASTTTFVSIVPNVTIQSAASASGGSGNLTYVWVRTGTSSATLTGSDITYDLNSDLANYSTAGVYYFNRYAKDATCNTAWLAAAGTYTLTVNVRPDGGCTYTAPAVVGTFADFHTKPAYTSATYTSLTDERDNKIYPVVKLGGRWIMARNLNYQGTTGIPSSTLTFNNRSDQAHGNTYNAYNTASAGSYAIGSFWCPGGYSSSAVTSSTYSCDVWGALYTWETAMSFDGKGNWSESAHTYNPNGGAANSDAAKANHGRTGSGLGTGGRGICPVNWHVPTDNEWGKILDAMEANGTGTSTIHQTTTSTGYIGTYAGKYGKSTCTTSSSSGAGVDDTHAYWYYNTDPTKGDDKYGFRVLPSGVRSSNGSNFYNRGTNAYFWSSSAYDGTSAWMRLFSYTRADVYRSYGYYRSAGFSVRCIRDSD